MKTPNKKPGASVFGVTVHGESLDVMMSRVMLAISGQQTTWIVTANPEILLAAKRDPSYAIILEQADQCCVDGIGLRFGLRALGRPVVRVTGVTLAERLIQEAATHHWKVGFLGGAPGVAEQVQQMWQARFPGLATVAEEGGVIHEDGTGDQASEEALHRLVLAAPDILLVAFGGGQKQERWIAKQIASFPALKVIAGVGGTFDFWTGRIKRAPMLLQKVGFEWLWRLIQEPRRIGRILRATMVFPTAFYIDALKRPGQSRKLALYALTILARMVFFVWVLVPALERYVQVVRAAGVRHYHWSFADLIVPFVVYVVLYPVVRFFASL